MFGGNEENVRRQNTLFFSFLNSKIIQIIAAIFFQQFFGKEKLFLYKKFKRETRNCLEMINFSLGNAGFLVCRFG
jgi:hypothetical protein